MENFLILDNVVKRIRERKVLDGVSFGVKKGETVVVAGTSGAGKSTLLRAVNRLIDIDSGDIIFNGESIYEIEPISLRRKAAMVFQVPALFNRTVKENIEYPLKLQGINDDARIQRALIDAGLDPSFLDRKALNLSIGEQQRVSIARTLVLEPALLLLDEPTASLDPQNVEKIETTVKHLKNERNLTILWVTHDYAQAKRIGDRILLLKEGKIKGVEDLKNLNNTHNHAKDCCTSIHKLL